LSEPWSSLIALIEKQMNRTLKQNANLHEKLPYVVYALVDKFVEYEGSD